MKRTSLNFDEGLLKEIRHLAQSRSVTMTEIVHALIREGLSAYRQRLKGERTYSFKFPVVKGTLSSHANLADRKSLYDLMDNL